MDNNIYSITQSEMEELKSTMLFLHENHFSKKGHDHLYKLFLMLCSKKPCK